MFEGRVARVHGDGDPLDYSTGPEYRTRDELQRIVDQLPGCKVTLLHPDAAIGGPRGEMSNDAVVGVIVSARLDGDHAVATFVVHDEQALDAIRSGIKELSLGYLCGLDNARRQIGTRVDHLAIVPAARCGESCALRADQAPKACSCSHVDESTATVEARDLPKGPLSETNVIGQHMSQDYCQACKDAGHASCICKSRATRYPSGDSMLDASPEKIVMDELKTQLAAAIADAAAQRARADAADAKLVTTEAARDNAVATAAAEKIRADAAEASKLAEVEAAKAAATAAAEQIRKDAATERTASVRARVALETSANRVLGAADADGKAVDRNELTDRAIKVAIVKHVDALDIPDDKVDAYVDAMYDGALQRHARTAGSRSDALVEIQQMRKDGANVLPTGIGGEKAAQDAFRRNLANAWMTGQE